MDRLRKREKQARVPPQIIECARGKKYIPFALKPAVISIFTSDDMSMAFLVLQILFVFFLVHVAPWRTPFFLRGWKGAAFCVWSISIPSPCLMNGVRPMCEQCSTMTCGDEIGGMKGERRCWGHVEITWDLLRVGGWFWFPSRIQSTRTIKVTKFSSVLRSKGRVEKF